MTERQSAAHGRREKQAATRARAAADRARELRARLERLQAGEPSSPDDVRDARLAVERALAAGILALENAADAHARAAAAHRSAAVLLDRVGRHAQADAHRLAADADDADAMADAASSQESHRRPPPQTQEQPTDP
ncbi:MAG: hypothetical protein HOQ45_15065 [Nocardioidaceae bacterium]|nr:hypothetical protein [Nocardioidaceae bacterium]